MSVRLFANDVLFEQRLLASGGFYKGKLDGLWGPKSEAAEVASQNEYSRLATKYGWFDTRSEKAIQTLLPRMQYKARQLLSVAGVWGKTNGVTVSILSGTRTYAEQNILFAKRPKVTNARGGQSNHNFGIALDVGIFSKTGKYLTGATKAEVKLYAALGAKIKDSVMNLDWGGDWKSFPDAPHYQFVTGMKLAEVRAKFEAGKLSIGESNGG